MKKAELSKRIEELERQLEAERRRPTGHHLTNCHIDMSKPDAVKLAIAEAVAEGMRALQHIGSGNNYGIYFAAPGETDECY